MEAELEGVKAQLAESRTEGRDYRARISELEDKIKTGAEGTAASVTKLNQDIKTYALVSTPRLPTQLLRNFLLEAFCPRFLFTRMGSPQGGIL